MRAAAQLAFSDTEARCPKCRKQGSEYFRTLWGCDQPAAAPVFARTCPRCNGYALECDLCGGTGVEQVRRCAPSQIDAQTAEVFQAYSMLDRGFMPQEGGSREQSAIFMDAVQIIDAERNSIDSDRRDTEARKVKKGAR